MPKNNLKYFTFLFKRSLHKTPVISASDINEGKIYVGNFVLEIEKNTKITKNHVNMKIADLCSSERVSG